MAYSDEEAALARMVDDVFAERPQTGLLPDGQLDNPNLSLQPYLDALAGASLDDLRQMIYATRARLDLWKLRYDEDAVVLDPDDADALRTGLLGVVAAVQHPLVAGLSDADPLSYAEIVEQGCDLVGRLGVFATRFANSHIHARREE